MKLLLTSAGISNESIKKAFFELVGKPAGEIKVAFIPTAANVEPGDKWWVIKDLAILQEMALRQIDIVDVSALPVETILDRFGEADVLFFEGGNEFHLMRMINKSGLVAHIPELLKDKVWVGVSAGSMVVGIMLSVAGNDLYDEEGIETESMKALGLVDFDVWPHLNSPGFPKLKVEAVKKVIGKPKYAVYVIDDNSAIKVIDDTVEVISEGKWEKFN